METRKTISYDGESDKGIQIYEKLVKLLSQSIDVPKNAIITYGNIRCDRSRIDLEISYFE